MKQIQDTAGFVFILAVVVLSVISVLGVWDIFGGDVILKSFETIGLLGIVALIVIAAGHAIETKQTDPMVPPALPHPAFSALRHLTVVVLIVCAVLLAFLGVLAIWDVLPDGALLSKSLSSLGIISFSSFVIVITCLDREGKSTKPKAVVPPVPPVF